MAKLIMLSGLPASGKSTKAQQLLNESGNAVRLNRDLLRSMLHFDKWTGKNEGMTVDAEKELAAMFLVSGKNVIIDDTNLTPRHKDMWQEIAELYGAKFQHIHVDTDWKTCVIRDMGRDKSVGQDTIVQMAMANGLKEAPERGYVVCDLDGTLCDISQRLHHVKPAPGQDPEEAFRKNWKAFFEGISEDKMREEVFEQLLTYYLDGYEIVFVSARPDTYRKETQAWLERNVMRNIEWTTLIMRKAGDHRLDTEVKAEILEKYLDGGKHVAMVFDDRPSVIRMWREHGLPVTDVGSGKEF